MRDVSRIIHHMDLRAELLEAKNLYCERTGLAPATAASKAANDGKFFDRIENGGNFTIETFEKVMAWFRKNTPAQTRKRKHGHP